MDNAKVALSAALIAAVAGTAWLYRDNARLRDELAGRPAAAIAVTGPKSDGDGAGADDHPSADTAPVATTAGKALYDAPRERPTLPDVKPPAETRGERRLRKQQEIAALLGRLDGETAEEYRDRMVPFVETMLSLPRSRAGDQRREIEDAAGVTEAQRAEMDALFDDVHAEVLELTNRAIATGELTPYERNWGGALNFAGGVGAILNGAEGRIGQILSPEQSATIYDMGFEWGEYLGVTVPWERLEPPPPPGT